MVPVIQRVNHVAVSVTDMSRSLSFYRDLLGLELLAFNPSVESTAGYETVVGLKVRRAEWALLAATADRVELYCYKDPKARPQAADHNPSDAGLSHLAFQVDDANSLCDIVAEAGYRVVSRPVNLGRHTSFYVYGPDQEILEILEERNPNPPFAVATAAK